MRRTVASLATTLLLVAGLGITQPAQATGGGEALAYSHLGRVSFTVANGQFEGIRAELPVQFTYERWGEDYGKVSITVDLQARQVGSRVQAGFLETFVNWSFSAAQQGTGDGVVFITPTSSSTEPFLIYGWARFTRYNDQFEVVEEVQVAFQPVVAVTVAKRVSTLTNVRAGSDFIMGQATVPSVFGTIGAAGQIAVRYRAPRERRWTYVTDFIDCPEDRCLGTDRLGNFNIQPASPIPPRAQVEVSLYNCSGCTDAKQTVTRGA